MRAARATGLAAAAAFVLVPGGARAAEAHLDGAALGLGWTLPFAGALLSIALLPLLAPRFWHHHFGKVSLFWSLCALLPMALLHGAGLTLY